MREIKFRAYNTITGFMSEPATLRELLVDVNQSARATGGDIDLDGFVYLEFTGLKDKNGVEIYEGDVVSEWWFDEGVGEESGKKHIVKFDQENAMFTVWRGPNVDQHTIKVIGNIYENPELLTQPGAA
jgi:uncharacterized phage protein (TIGR01671 family)